MRGTFDSLILRRGFLIQCAIILLPSFMNLKVDIILYLKYRTETLFVPNLLLVSPNVVFWWYIELICSIIPSISSESNKYKKELTKQLTYDDSVLMLGLAAATNREAPTSLAAMTAPSSPTNRRGESVASTGGTCSGASNYRRSCLTFSISHFDI